jgi:hypothetical protein
VLTCHLVDEGSDRLVNEVAFEFIPTGNQATAASLLQLEEGAQDAEDVIANGPLPAHEELLGMAELLEGPMERTRCPSADDARGERSPGPLSFAFFSWVVLRVVPHGVVFIDRSKHRHKAELT